MLDLDANSKDRPDKRQIQLDTSLYIGSLVSLYLLALALSIVIHRLRQSRLQQSQVCWNLHAHSVLSQEFTGF